MQVVPTFHITKNLKKSQSQRVCSIQGFNGCLIWMLKCLIIITKLILTENEGYAPQNRVKVAEIFKDNPFLLF